MTDLDWFQSWYLERANGTWEHERGVRITTLDNPGWALKVDLVGTPFESLPEREIQVEISEQNWIYCKIASGRFEGHGGPLNLATLISTFRKWVASDSTDVSPGASTVTRRGEPETASL